MGLPRRQQEHYELPLERKPKPTPDDGRAYYCHQCRACGKNFRAIRFDALACSPRCQKRLERGTTYVRELPKREQARERKRHARADRTRELVKQQAADVRQEREANRPARLERRQAKVLAQQQRADTRLEREVEAEQAIEARARRLWLSEFLTNVFDEIAELETHLEGRKARQTWHGTAWLGSVYLINQSCETLGADSPALPPTAAREQTFSDRRFGPEAYIGAGGAY
jgi:hypothetical protein